MDNLVTKADFHKEMSSLAWKLAGFLVAQVAIIVTLVKII
jgi:hypothetical protein